MTAGTSFQSLVTDCARLPKANTAVSEATKRAQARCRELYPYLENNFEALTDYGWRYLNGFPISSSRAEGCVDGHRQHPDGQAPTHEMVSNRRTLCGRHTSRFSRWPINCFTSSYGGITPKVLPTPQIDGDTGFLSEDAPLVFTHIRLMLELFKSVNQILERGCIWAQKTSVEHRLVI